MYVCLPRDATQSTVLLSRRLSVCPSVTLGYCDYIGWNSSKIISPLASLGCSLFADPNIMELLQGEHPEILTGIGKGIDVKNVLEKIKNVKKRKKRWQNKKRLKTLNKKR